MITACSLTKMNVFCLCTLKVLPEIKGQKAEVINPLDN